MTEEQRQEAIVDGIATILAYATWGVLIWLAAQVTG